MPLPAEWDTNVRKSFQDLIKHGHDLLSDLTQESELEFSHLVVGEVTSLRLQTQSLVRLTLGNTPRGASVQEELFAVSDGFHGIRELVGILEALQSDYVNGFNIGLEDIILAEAARDYMSQADALLGDGVPGQFDHVPAAVLCGAVLENRIRTYCEQQRPPLPTVTPKGDAMTLGPLISELDKANAFDKQTRNMLKSWADIRNHAAHGRFDEFSREQVELMLMGANQFLANQL